MKTVKNTRKNNHGFEIRILDSSLFRNKDFSLERPFEVLILEKWGLILQAANAVSFD